MFFGLRKKKKSVLRQERKNLRSTVVKFQINEHTRCSSRSTRTIDFVARNISIYGLTSVFLRHMAMKYRQWHNTRFPVMYRKTEWTRQKRSVPTYVLRWSNPTWSLPQH